MKKKIFALLLAVLMVAGVMSSVSFAEENETAEGVEVTEENYTDYEIYRKEDYVDSFGMTVKIYTYAKEDVASNDSLIVYVVNHCGEYIGTEDDNSIILDYLNEGYVVAVLDYDDQEQAVSPNLETSVQTIRVDMRGNGTRANEKYLGSRKVNPNHTFVLPAGYRLARDVVFFKMATEGSQGALNQTLHTYNTQSSVAEEFYTRKVDNEYIYRDMVERKEDGVDSNGNTKYVYNFKEGSTAATIYDIIMKDGHKMTDEDMNLKLDIIYPSNPIKETPVAVLAASGTPRGNSGVKINRQHNLGFLFRGYTTVCYDHEYMPFMNTDVGGWGHLESQYTTQSYDGIKTHTAAIRCIKYYADEYGYSSTKIGVYGHSKSSWSSLLTNPKAVNLPENGGTYTPLGKQPFLEDKNGDPIDSTITCAYHSMGNGSARYAKYLTSQNVPTIICCGQNDSGNGCNYWEAEKAAYIKSGIEHLAIDMIDLGHDYPNGDDPVFDYNRYEAFCRFFDYYLKGTAPELLYTSVSEGQLKRIVTTKNPIGSHSSSGKTGPWTVEEGDQLYVQFVAPVTEWTFLDAVSLKNSDGIDVEGYWYAEGNGNKWIFAGKLAEGESYTLTLKDNTAKDKYGRVVKEGITVTFTK